MESTTFARGPMIAITVLRVLVGWHFLYEGLSKLTAPSWSAAGYLKQAKGPLAESFRGLATNPGMLANSPLRSGWAWGQNYLEGGTTAFEATVGNGKVLAFGPEITFRAQPHGTFKFMLNGIHSVGRTAPAAGTASR